MFYAQNGCIEERINRKAHKISQRLKMKMATLKNLKVCTRKNKQIEKKDNDISDYVDISINRLLSDYRQ